MKVETIKLSQIRITDNRIHGGQGDVKILAEDMMLNGLINPVTVKPIPGEKLYEIVAGRRRIAAAVSLDWKEIDAKILEGNEVERAENIAGAENINRMEMHPLDEADLFKKLIEKGDTIESLCKRFDRKKSEIWQRLQLLELNKDIKDMFRKGRMSLHAAVMLKSLDEKKQAQFVKAVGMKNDNAIKEWDIERFLREIQNDKLYSFLTDTQCEQCKTRTFFGNKELFPELEDEDNSCLNHNCYMKRWEKVLSDRIKSIIGEHKEYATADIIVMEGYHIKDILGKSIKLNDVTYKVVKESYLNRADKKDKGALPCFNVQVSGSGKLEVTRRYWKKAEKSSSSSGSSGMSSTEKRRKLSPIVDMLVLPKEEKDVALKAMSESRRITPYGLRDNVRDSVFWKIIELKAQEFKEAKTVSSNYKEIFLKKYFFHLAGTDKRIFELFVADMSINDLAKIDSDKIFGLLLAMEWNTYDMVDPDDLIKGKQCEILKWIGLASEKLKQLYREEISRRIPKQKPQKPEAKKKTTVKKPVVKKVKPIKPTGKPLPTPQALAKKRRMIKT